MFQFIPNLHQQPDTLVMLSAGIVYERIWNWFENDLILIEEDDDTRPVFKELLTNKGYKVKLAINEADALEKAGNGIGRIDVVLVDLVKKPTAEMLKSGERIREKGELNVPVVAIAEEYKDELQGTSAQVGENEYLVYLEDSNLVSDAAFYHTAAKQTSSGIWFYPHRNEWRCRQSAGRSNSLSQSEGSGW